MQKYGLITGVLMKAEKEGAMKRQCVKCGSGVVSNLPLVVIYQLTPKD